MVGTSGNARVRAPLVMANARSLPSLTRGTAGGSAPNEMGVCPAIVEATESPPLLNGTCARSRPRDIRKSSPTSCGGVPRLGRRGIGHHFRTCVTAANESRGSRLPAAQRCELSEGGTRTGLKELRLIAGCRTVSKDRSSRCAWKWLNRSAHAIRQPASGTGTIADAAGRTNRRTVT